MTTKPQKIKLYLIFVFLLINGCAFSPGMKDPKESLFGGTELIFNGDSYLVPITELNEETFSKVDNNFQYILGIGDSLTMIIWGLPEAFPSNINMAKGSPQQTRVIDSNGDVFLPYVGNVSISGLSIPEAKEVLTNKLATRFKNPQLDLSLFEPNNSNSIYLLGEISQPKEIKLSEEPLVLSNAIAKSRGLNPVTSNPKNVFILRTFHNDPIIYRINLSRADSLFLAKSLVLKPNDIIFVGSSSITKWNRLVGQLFPFASFLNQIDQVDNRN